jgi:hypothetical protein
MEPFPTIGGRLLPIPLPDLRRPELMPSLPAWVVLRIASIRDEVQPDPETNKHRKAATLPCNLTLSQMEREVIESHIRGLEQQYGPTPAGCPETEAAMLIELTKLMLTLPSFRQNQASAEARGEAYMTALDDVPVWAVRAAIRRWCRGDAGLNDRRDPYDYNWCPAPADLRKIALRELCRIQGRVAELRRLLSAEPLIEFADEHCHAMRVRLVQLMHETFGIPLVGKDGSSGTVSESGS